MPIDPAGIEAIALLDEPARRALYDAVARAAEPLGREEAAAAAGVTRALAAFHLDKLVAAGLLAVEYRRRSGRRGPGAGRPAKLYRRSAVEVAVSLPDRHYQVPALLFASAMERMGNDTPPEPLRAAAHELGEGIGAAARAQSGPRPSGRKLRAVLHDVLESRGYEPMDTPTGEIRFANCPFHALVADHRDLVCGTNLALADGLLDGLGAEGLTARLDPQPGQCCVAITGAAPSLGATDPAP